MCPCVISVIGLCERRDTDIVGKLAACEPCVIKGILSASGLTSSLSMLLGVANEAKWGDGALWM